MFRVPHPAKGGKAANPGRLSILSTNDKIVGVIKSPLWNLRYRYWLSFIPLLINIDKYIVKHLLKKEHKEIVAKIYEMINSTSYILSLISSFFDLSSLPSSRSLFPPPFFLFSFRFSFFSPRSPHLSLLHSDTSARDPPFPSESTVDFTPLSDQSPVQVLERACTHPR